MKALLLVIAALCIAGNLALQIHTLHDFAMLLQAGALPTILAAAYSQFRNRA